MLIKTFIYKKFSGAQKVKTLCLCSMAAIALVESMMMGAGNAQAQMTLYTANAGANTEIRLQQMEAQMRELTGQIEKQIYEINLLKAQIKKLEHAKASKTNALPRYEAPPPGASQIAKLTRDKKVGTSVMAPNNENPLNLDFKPLAPSGMKTKTPGGAASGDATATYEMAYANIKVKKHEEAQNGFEMFLADHPEHVLAANAKYWLGETYYVRGEYKKSARIFAEGFQKFPDSAKAPDLLLKLGMSLEGMGKHKDACVALSQVEVKFPHSAAGVLGRAKSEMEKLDCGA